MITLFCLVLLGGLPSQVGVPLYAVVISLVLDIVLFATPPESKSRKD